MRRLAIVASVLLLSLPAGAARAAGDPAVAGLQVALARKGVYRGTIDGVDGKATDAAVKRLQARARLAVDGVVGPQTRGALGRFVRHRLGSRMLGIGNVGADVAELEFALAWAGFPSGPFDGRFGRHVLGALKRFQRSRGLRDDGLVGAATLAALRTAPPAPAMRLAEPVEGTLGDGFGPRGNRFHAGVDLLAPAGAPVFAAAPGRVVWAAERAGFGLLVTLAHGGGVRTLYAHLSRIDVRLGRRVAAGSPLGLVGATGDATGPHLHFEVRLRGAAVDPLPLLR